METLGLEGYSCYEHCFKLNNVIYGLVQASRQCQKKLKQEMKDIVFEDWLFKEVTNDIDKQKNESFTMFGDEYSCLTKECWSQT